MNLVFTMLWRAGWGLVFAGADPEPQVSASFEGTARECPIEAERPFEMHIQLPQGFKINERPPFRLEVEAQGLELIQTVFTYEDLKVETAGARIESQFRCIRLGEATVQASLQMMICNDERCLRVRKDLETHVAVQAPTE